MTRNIDKNSLEAAIVRNCSPALAGLKPACLFTFPGSFLLDDEESEHDAAADGRPCNAERDEVETAAETPVGARLVATNRKALLEAIGQCAEDLRRSGIRLRVLTWRACGALIYLYRPAMLGSWLDDPRASEPLRSLGYKRRSIEQDLDHLAQRLGGAPVTRDRVAPCPCVCPRGDSRCAKDFPHKIGYFLGYPYDDVTGFIRNKGERFLAFGQWKVYADLEGALATFARYRRCTTTLTTAYRSGREFKTLATADA